MTPEHNLAVVARRHEPADSLDFFPTPPWATRALLHELHGINSANQLIGFDPHVLSVLDPCCGEGHMAGVLDEFFERVVPLDIHDYGYGGTRDFLDTSKPDLEPVDWVICNPPFGQLSAFIMRALDVATCGVAVLCRTQALEGVSRFNEIWNVRAPDWILPFCERVPMLRGRWVVNGSTATGYMWLVWNMIDIPSPFPVTRWIAPGAKQRHSKAGDDVRFNGVYRKPHLIWDDKAQKKKRVYTYHTPTEWAAMKGAA